MYDVTTSENIQKLLTGQMEQTETESTIIDNQAELIVNQEYTNCLLEMQLDM